MRFQLDASRAPREISRAHLDIAHVHALTARAYVEPARALDLITPAHESTSSALLVA